MEQRLFIISDLHLGGMLPSADSPGFQMCSEAGAKRLASFIAWAGKHRSADRSLHLVLAGDVVDFLAEEEPFESFTADDERARRKLVRAMSRTHLVWEALSAFVAAGNELTVMLGNHDIELALPGPRRELLQQLGRDRLERWKVEFLDDNRAFVSGPLLIEHGNRYDKWNGQPLATLSGHSFAVVALAFSPDGSRLATASNDNTARLWNGTTGELLATLPGPDACSDMRFSPDSKHIIVAFSNGTVQIYAATGEGFFTQACQIVRYFQEWDMPEGSDIKSACPPYLDREP